LGPGTTAMPDETRGGSKRGSQMKTGGSGELNGQNMKKGFPKNHKKKNHQPLIRQPRNLSEKYRGGTTCCSVCTLIFEMMGGTLHAERHRRGSREPGKGNGHDGGELNSG